MSGYMCGYTRFVANMHCKAFVDPVYFQIIQWREKIKRIQSFWSMIDLMFAIFYYTLAFETSFGKNLT